MVTHVGDSILKELAILGSGYSGEVKRVQDENGQVYALKVSNDKQVRFCLPEVAMFNGDRATMTLPEASEFEKLRRLYAAGVPVPRPFGFQIYSSAEGRGTTLLLMELVKGQTLRDWLSEQPGGRQDKLSGRSVHPAMTYVEGIARIDVAISVLTALLRLRRLGFFADFKPRNIMIKESRDEGERHCAACLVDIGGVVLYQDVSTEIAYRRSLEQTREDSSSVLFSPTKDRYLVSFVP